MNNLTFSAIDSIICFTVVEYEEDSKVKHCHKFQNHNMK